MKLKNFTDEQIIKTLKRIDTGEKAKDTCRELGVHEKTYYNWKRIFRAWKLISSENTKCFKMKTAD